jgi:hypothetical protein
MNIISYVFIALVLLMLNEYRLIKKHTKAIENSNNTINQPITRLVFMPFIKAKNWINDTVLNNELNN